VTTRQQSVRVGAAGVELFFETGLDLEDASAIAINYRKPSGEVGSFTGTATSKPAPRDNVTHGAKYVTTTDDLDEAGEWEFQVHATIDGFSAAGETATLDVDEALEGA